MAEDMSESDNWLLIANGTSILESKLRQFAADKRIMVLDGAYLFVKNLGLKIDILLGDFDSIPADLLREAYKTDTLVVHTPDQNKTDLEKGLLYLDQLGAKNIDICCSTGGRLQHTIYNLRMLKKFYNPTRPIVLQTETESICYYEDREICIEGKINDSVALLGFPETVLTTQGLKYEMRDCSLVFEQYISASNALALEKAIVHIVGGALIIHENNLLKTHQSSVAINSLG